MSQRVLWLPWRRDRDESPAKASGDDGAATPAAAGDELRVRREEIGRMEERALRETESLAIQRADVDRRTQALTDRERNLEQGLEELKQSKRVQRRELERLSGLSAAQAKQLLLADVEQEARQLAGLRLAQIEEETKTEAERRARNILAVATARLASKHASESTTRLVELPNDEMKGRIIGREGRNIRALEKLTGVDVIIDETPSAVVLSSFDGVRREMARVTLERLIADGRIHPAMIEETYEHVREETESRIAEEGAKAALEARVTGLEPELQRLLGQLRFRTSYGQNVLDHLVECSHLAALIAEELGASVETARRAALLHDIGKAVTHEVEGPHALVGGRIARRNGESEAVAHAIEAHHGEVEPRTVEAVIVQAADAVSGRSPGRPRRRARAVRRPAARPRGDRRPPPWGRARVRDARRARDPRDRRPRRGRRRARGPDRTRGRHRGGEGARVPGPDQGDRDPREPSDLVCALAQRRRLPPRRR